MKRSKSSTINLVAALTLCAMFAANVLGTRSTVEARARVSKPLSSKKPIKGVDVFVTKNPGGAVRSLQTDAEGSYTVADLPPGLYQVSLACKARCQGMNDLGAGVVQFTLTGANESSFKRNMSKQQLVDGVKFPFEIGRKGGQVKGSIGIDSGAG